MNFLHQLNVSEEDAVCYFKLAPLRARRDIAMLGVLHRSVLKKGPPHFARFFCLDTTPSRVRRKHNRQLIDSRPIHRLELYSRSALSLPWVYNLLPQWVVDATTVRDFQSNLQCLMSQFLLCGGEHWPSLFSPRLSYTGHPLRSGFRISPPS